MVECTVRKCSRCYHYSPSSQWLAVKIISQIQCDISTETVPLHVKCLPRQVLYERCSCLPFVHFGSQLSPLDSIILLFLLSSSPPQTKRPQGTPPQRYARPHSHGVSTPLTTIHWRRPLDLPAATRQRPPCHHMCMHESMCSGSGTTKEPHPLVTWKTPSAHHLSPSTIATQITLTPISSENLVGRRKLSAPETMSRTMTNHIYARSKRATVHTWQRQPELSLMPTA